MGEWYCEGDRGGGKNFLQSNKETWKCDIRILWVPDGLPDQPQPSGKKPKWRREGNTTWGPMVGRTKKKRGRAFKSQDDGGRRQTIRVGVKPVQAPGTGVGRKKDKEAGLEGSNWGFSRELGVRREKQKAGRWE